MREYILKKLKHEGSIHMTLIDPEKTTPEEAGKIAVEAEEAGTSAIMVGGSIGVSEKMTDDVVVEIKEKTNLPVILFPGSPTALSKYADAVWFLSVLNSQNPYFITGAQMQGAFIVKRYGLEVLSLGYIILGTGGTVSIVSYTRPLPLDKPEVVAAYALAAEYMGFQFIYLEGGSGGKPVPQKVISLVKRTISIPLVVGGGIRTRVEAKKAAAAGADIIVTGTIIEETDNIYDKLSEIIRGIKEGYNVR